MIHHEPWLTRLALSPEIERAQEQLYRDLEHGAISPQEFAHEMQKIRSRSKGAPEPKSEGLLRENFRGRLTFTQEWLDAHKEEVEAALHPNWHGGVLTRYDDSGRVIDAVERWVVGQPMRSPLLQRLNRSGPGLWHTLHAITGNASQWMYVGGYPVIAWLASSTVGGVSSIQPHSEYEYNRYVRMLYEAILEMRELWQRYLREHPLDPP